MIEFLMDMSLWYNLIFTVPILFVILYLIMQVVGLTLSSVGGDVDTDAGEVDVDTDVDADVDTDADTDLDADMDGLSVLERAMAFVNVGKVPLTIILATFLLFWGITGFSFNGIIRQIFGSFPSPFIIVSCSLALVFGITATKFLSGIIAKLVPGIETYSSNNESLLGQTAQVVSDHVTSTFGRARLRDPYGNLLTIYCKVLDGKEVPKRGDEILLVDYDSSSKIFEVTKV